MLHMPNPLLYRKKSKARNQVTKEDSKTCLPFQYVPRFFDFYHPTTVWLLNVIRSENEKEMMRVLMDKQSKSLLQFVPDSHATQTQHTVMNAHKNEFVFTKAKYFQIIDRPDLYEKSNPRSALFGRHTVMYLTPLGLAIYLNKPKAARILVECIDRDTNKKHILARQPQYITFMNDRYGDLMCLYDHNLAMLNESYDILALMIRKGNWFPMEPFQLIYRKRFVETQQTFDDFMDYAFYLLFTRRSSMNIPGLCSALMRYPTEHFKPTYLAQPSRANKRTLLRDVSLVINNCKTYPRRLLRCAYYADKKMKSSLNLVRAAEIFIQTGMFQLTDEPELPFIVRSGRKRRLECMLPYKERARGMNVDWPAALYEFDADCCIALLLGIIAKCHRLNKRPTFQNSLHLVVRLLRDCSWLNYFDEISDLEFKDYFMGLDDAEKVVFRPEVFGFARECARVSAIDRYYDLASFFSEEKIDKTRALYDIKDPATITQMMTCSDKRITSYVTLETGDSLKTASSIISGDRVRGEGRDDPKNKHYMSKLGFPPESVHTMMINAANIEMESDDDSDNSETDDDDDDDRDQESGWSDANEGEMQDYHNDDAVSGSDVQHVNDDNRLQAAAEQTELANEMADNHNAELLIEQEVNTKSATATATASATASATATATATASSASAAAATTTATARKRPQLRKFGKQKNQHQTVWLRKIRNNRV